MICTGTRAAMQPRPRLSRARRRRSPVWPRWVAFQALRTDPRLWMLPLQARIVWAEIFAAAHRPHYGGRLPFADTRQVALACGVPLPILRQHLAPLLTSGLVREAAGGLIAETAAWPS